MPNFRDKKFILLIILIIIGVFFMSDLYKAIYNSITKKIEYFDNLRTGEVTEDNGDGTYDVKIANADSAYPDVETLSYTATFGVGEIVTIGFEYGSKENPKILGHSKKIAQEPKEIEVNYSGESEGGQQTVDININGDIKDGIAVYFFWDGGGTYSVLHAFAGEAFFADNEEEDWVGQGYVYNDGEGKWQTVISKLYLFFDTSVIPINAVITSAKIRFVLSNVVECDTHFNLVVQDGQPNYPHSPINGYDYNHNFYKNNGGQLNTSEMTDEDFNYLILNTNGKNWINIGGMTKFCLRNSREIAAINPKLVHEVQNDEHITICTADNEYAEQRPKLTITYTI